MAAAACLLGALTTALCSLLLIKHYARVRLRLLLWSGLCFGGLTLSNILLLADAALAADRALLQASLAVACAALLTMLFGLISASDAS